MAKTNVPIKQHYVPKFYLNGFTENEQDEDCLHVISQITGKQYKARCGELAIQKNIYSLDTDNDEAKYAVENTLGEIESGIGRIIPEVVKSKAMPIIDKDYCLLMEFIAIMETRVPKGIDRLNQLYDFMSRPMLLTMVQSKEIYESQINKLKEEGVKIENVSYEKMKKFVESDKYDIKVDQNTLMQQLIKTVNIIYPTLCDRTWSLYKTNSVQHNFICSDHPVFLGWTKLPKARWMQHSPGHDLKNTHVTVPLNKQYAIRGVFNGKSEVVLCSDEQIALINSQIFCRANNIYSCKQDFIWRDNNGKICNVDNLKKRINENRQKKKDKVSM